MQFNHGAQRLLCLIPDAAFQDLLDAARHRRRHAFRPGTQVNHDVQFRLYIAFCVRFRRRDINPSVDTMCAYVEFLARQFTSPASIRNYISGVRLLHKYLDVHAPALAAFELHLLLRALDITLMHRPLRRLPLELHHLQAMCGLCTAAGPSGLVIKTALLVGFFGFLRQSNLVPPSAATFDRLRHTCRGDVFFAPPGMLILLKWTKTHQSGDNAVLIPLPMILDSPLCPVTATRLMMTTLPAGRDQSLFLLPAAGQGHVITPTAGALPPLTLPALREAFTVLLTAIGLNPDVYSLHSLRRGGASASYQAGVDAVHIQKHGTWRSDAFWNYIATDFANAPVPQALASLAQACP